MAAAEAVAHMAPNETLQELNALLQKVEVAQLESRPLAPEEVAALDIARFQGLFNTTQSDPVRMELRSIAHRLWAAMGHQPGDRLQDAKCRSLACELFVWSLKESMSPQDSILLAAHWAFAGRAWILANEPTQSQRCFQEVAKLWKLRASAASPASLAPVVAQAFLWAGEAYCRHAAYSEAFSNLAQAREIICEQINGLQQQQMPKAQFQLIWLRRNKSSFKHPNASKLIFFSHHFCFSICCFGAASFSSHTQNLNPSFSRLDDFLAICHEQAY